MVLDEKYRYIHVIRQCYTSSFQYCSAVTIQSMFLQFCVFLCKSITKHRGTLYSRNILAYRPVIVEKNKERSYRSIAHANAWANKKTFSATAIRDSHNRIAHVHTKFFIIYFINFTRLVFLLLTFSLLFYKNGIYI